MDTVLNGQEKSKKSEMEAEARVGQSKRGIP